MTRANNTRVSTLIAPASTADLRAVMEEQAREQQMLLETIVNTIMSLLPRRLREAINPLTQAILIRLRGDLNPVRPSVATLHHDERVEAPTRISVSDRRSALLRVPARTHADARISSAEIRAGAGAGTGTVVRAGARVPIGSLTTESRLASTLRATVERIKRYGPDSDDDSDLIEIANREAERATRHLRPR